MHVRCHAPADRSTRLFLEPWGEEHEIPADTSLDVVAVEEEGGSEFMEIRWTERGMVLWPPRGSRVQVFTPSGQALGEDIAPRPPTP